MLFRLRCHFCGTRSKHSKGTTEFQCQSCEAWNFYDRKGAVVDTPARVAAAPRSQPAPIAPSRTFAKSGMEHFATQDTNQTFCQTCLTNQRIFTESLANYLPDESHAQYYEYERKLPQYKADLERRYPQICKKCAPKAQASISRADRYGMQRNVAKNMRDTAARRGRSNKGQRDDWGKWTVRRFFGLLGWILYAALLVQMAWHAYGLLNTAFASPTLDESDLPFEMSDDVRYVGFGPRSLDSASESLPLRLAMFCFGQTGAEMPKSLLITFLLLWYNPGMPLWYHHTIRVEHVHGRSQYYLIQVMVLFVRTVAWSNLSNRLVIDSLTTSQLLAAHGFMLAFIPLIQKYSERIIRFDVWRIRGKMMKSPEEGDVFGAYAGPERALSPPQASSIPPTRLFARNESPFPIENLAPRSTRSNSNHSLPYQPPPSPPDSQSVSDDDADYQMDWQPSVKPQMPGAPNDRTYQPRMSRGGNNTYDHGMTQSAGWGSMRNELSGIQSRQSLAQQRMHEEAEQAKLHQQQLQAQSPFRGTLPLDPMQRRLRSEQPQLQPKQTPLSQQPDFLRQMSQPSGSKHFNKTPNKIGNLSRPGQSSAKKNVSFANGLSLNDDDEDFSPVKHRPRGSLELRDSQWRYPEKAEATGLEELFGGGSFRIADEPGVKLAEVSRGAEVGSWPWKKISLYGGPVLVAVVCWNVAPLRRTLCLWLAGKLEGMGY